MCTTRAISQEGVKRLVDAWIDDMSVAEKRRAKDGCSGHMVNHQLLSVTFDYLMGFDGRYLAAVTKGNTPMTSANPEQSSFSFPTLRVPYLPNRDDSSTHG